MARAVSKICEFEYKLKAEQNEAGATVFRLRPLTAAQFMRAGEISTSDGRASSCEYVLRTALLGWKDFHDDAGPVEWSGYMADNLARLTFEQLMELTNAVIDASKVMESERKN